MADKSSIEWTDATWNPVMGCTPVSEGCENCYARALIGRFGKQNKGFPDEPADVTLYPERLGAPMHWKEPKRIFACSMSDLFHSAVPFVFITRVFDVMAGAPQHTFMVLTKRAGRMLRVVETLWRGFADAGIATPLPNVWLGVTAENQTRADERIPILLQIPAAMRFVSVEPMLGPVDLECYWGAPEGWGAPVGLDWVIAGGETGHGARPMDPAWAENALEQCQDVGVPFFYKGAGTATLPRNDPAYRLLSGQTWEEFP